MTQAEHGHVGAWDDAGGFYECKCGEWWWPDQVPPKGSRMRDRRVARGLIHPYIDHHNFCLDCDKPEADEAHRITVSGSDLSMLRHIVEKIDADKFDASCPDRNAVYTCINEARRIVGLSTPGWCQGGLHYYADGPCAWDACMEEAR